jgi:glycosyltransferase involved in cell wall biosynthesis
MKFMLQVAREVSKEVSRFKWLFVGIPEDAIQWTLENCSSVFLERHITMIPRWVPYSTVLDYAAKSRIGFNYHPRQRHLLVAIPMKVFEYMLCGLPLVTTALPELTNLMTHEKHGLLIDSDRPVDYANAIVSLLSNPEKGQSLGMAGQELVQSHLNWEKSEAWKLLSAYEGLLGNS